MGIVCMVFGVVFPAEDDGVVAFVVLKGAMCIEFVVAHVVILKACSKSRDRRLLTTSSVL